jgi:hypothetical protein
MPDRPKLTALNDETRNATGKNVGDSNFVLLCHTIHIAPHKYLLSTRACIRHIASLFSYYRPCLGTQRACVRVPSASGCVMGGVASIGTNVPMRGQAPPNTSASNAPQTPSTPTISAIFLSLGSHGDTQCSMTEFNQDFLYDDAILRTSTLFYRNGNLIVHHGKRFFCRHKST